MRSIYRGAVQRRDRSDQDERRAVRARRDPLRVVIRGPRGSPRRSRGARRDPCGTRRSCRPRGKARAAAACGAHSARERIVDVDDHEVEAVEAARLAAPHTSLFASCRNHELAPFGSCRRVGAELAPRERRAPPGCGTSRCRPGRWHRRRPQHLAIVRRPGPRETGPSRPNTVCNTRTPRSTSSSATTHDTRIVDVLIISMLMPSLAEHLEHLRGNH